MTSLQEKAVKSVFWVGSARTIGQATSWVVTILLIRILSPGDYGLMGMAIAYKAIVVIIYDLSLGEAVLQKDNLSEKDINTAFWLCFLSATILYGITWFAAIAWAHFFSNVALVNIIRVLGLSFIFLSIKEIPFRLMAREFEFKQRSMFELIAGVLSALISLVLAYNGYGVWSLVFGELSREVILTLFIFFYQKWMPKLIFSYSSSRQLLKYGLPITGHYLLNYFCNRSDFIIIGKLLGQNVLGYYTVALSLSRIPIDKGIFIIQRVMFPLFSKIQNDKAEMSRYYYKIVYIISVFSFPVLLGMLAISEEIVVLVLSPKWLPSLFSFRVFCVLGILQSYTGILLVILKARGNTKVVFKYSVYSAIFLPVGFFIFSKYGISGVSLSWLIVFPPLFGYLLCKVSAEIGVTFFETFKKVTPALTGSLLMLTVIIAMKATILKKTISFGSLTGYVVIGVLVYIGYFYLFSKKTFHDVKHIVDNLRA